MKFMKIIVLFAVSILLLTSCGDDSKKGADADSLKSSPIATETASPTPTEKPILNTVPWGEDSFTSALPECTFGAVTQITPGDDLCLVLVEQIEENEAVLYMDKLSERGFTCSGTDADLHTAGLNYKNADGITVNVVYTSGMMTLMIQK